MINHCSSQSHNFGASLLLFKNQATARMEDKMQQITGLDFKIKEMAGRIRELREIEGLTIEEMAVKTAVSVEEYKACENGESDLNFAFIYR